MPLYLPFCILFLFFLPPSLFSLSPSLGFCNKNQNLPSSPTPPNHQKLRRRLAAATILHPDTPLAIFPSAQLNPLSDWKNISCPVSSFSYSSLHLLDLSKNRISSAIPSDIGLLCCLTVLNLGNNDLSGGILASLTNLSSLMHLNLSNDRIYGQIPHDFGHLQKWSRALLSRNLIFDTIPPSIAMMSRLANLDLSQNRISGVIPKKIHGMSVLSSLYLDCNQVSSEIQEGLMRSMGLNMVSLS
ncbi:hypothetical protein MRB53_026002 [Persea americana]|uniref:Uncharacterized protein n=1 Tax=Persea americana TaxID=3435 RepID=A0ACC2LGT6_PERAE|nr:hypothetical protein MRB53_026002 [Persea americana]